MHDGDDAFGGWSHVGKLRQNLGTLNTGACRHESQFDDFFVIKKRDAHERIHQGRPIARGTERQNTTLGIPHFFGASA